MGAEKAHACVMHGSRVGPQPHDVSSKMKGTQLCLRDALCRRPCMDERHELILRIVHNKGARLDVLPSAIGRPREEYFEDVVELSRPIARILAQHCCDDGREARIMPCLLEARAHQHPQSVLTL